MKIHTLIVYTNKLLGLCKLNRCIGLSTKKHKLTDRRAKRAEGRRLVSLCFLVDGSMHRLMHISACNFFEIFEHFYIKSCDARFYPTVRFSID